MKESKSLSWRLFAVGVAIGFVGGFLLRTLYGSHESILTSKLLDWPFLTFVLLASFVGLFFDSLASLIARGEFTIAWSKDQSVKIRNLSAAVSGELSPLQEDIEALKSAVASLQGHPNKMADTEGINAPVSEFISSSTISATNTGIVEAQKRRLREALDNPKYKWRSVERLAAVAGLSEDEVIGLLLTQDDVRLSRSMTGHQIAGLRSRVGSA